MGSEQIPNDAHDADRDTKLQFRPVPGPRIPPSQGRGNGQQSDHYEQYEEPAYREHVSGPLHWQPANANSPASQPPYTPAQPPAGASVAAQPQQYQGVQPPAYGVPQHGVPSYPQQYYPPIPQGYQQYQPPAGYTGGYYNNGQAPYAGYPAPYSYQGNYAYPGYYPYPYQWQPARPKRDGYLLGIAIASFSGSILVLLGGLGCLGFLLLFAFVPTGSIKPDQVLSGVVLFTALAIAGVGGGVFGLYHSIRSLFLKKPSADFHLPWFWAFLILYLILIGIGAVLRINGQSVSNIPLTIVLIALAGILPALTILSLGVRRLHFPRSAPWATSWRRFTLALVSGATQAILLASIFELILTAVAVTSLGVTGFSLDNANQELPHDPRSIGLLFIVVSVIAPFVEEAVKPLAVVILVGRIRGAAEAFVLGLASGIGFDLIETSGYISQGYRDWLDVAIQRSSAGLLHGLGAAMVTLGWYYMTHAKEHKRHVLLALGCWAYAVLQHAIWNGSFILQLLPAPVGPYLDTGIITLGSISFPSFILVYIVETALMLTFFLFITGRLRTKQPLEPDAPKQGQDAVAAPAKVNTSIS